MVVLLEWALSASCLGAGCGFSVLPIVRQSHLQQSGFEQSARQFPEWTFRCEKDHVAVVVAIQAAAARASLTSVESAKRADSKLRQRHCEERSDEAIHTCFAARWIASLRSQ
jgi:hypothetical protein